MQFSTSSGYCLDCEGFVAVVFKDACLGFEGLSGLRGAESGYLGLTALFFQGLRGVGCLEAQGFMA